jgi:deoxyribonuclease V
MSLTNAWDITPSEAIQIQEALRSQVQILPLCFGQIKHVGGVDVGFPKGKETARAAIAVFSYPSIELVDQAVAELPVSFPYVPGLLSFREIPVILKALNKLGVHPDLIITDGHGLAHPRRFGLACHLGVLLDRSTIGCAKSVLIGEYEELTEARGSTSDLVDKGEIIGAALRTRERVKPVYVSSGHRVNQQDATQVVLNCGGGFRLPEPTRWAHQLASRKEPRNLKGENP